jgi:hypothetical protein
MNEQDRQLWNRLCDEAANESDPVRFARLTEEIAKMLQKQDSEDKARLD